MLQRIFAGTENNSSKRVKPPLRFLRRDLSRQGEKDLLLLLQTLNILAFAIMVALNLAAVLLPLNGQTTGEVARSYRVSLYRPGLPLPSGG